MCDVEGPEKKVFVFCFLQMQKLRVMYASYTQENPKYGLKKLLVMPNMLRKQELSITFVANKVVHRKELGSPIFNFCFLQVSKFRTLISTSLFSEGNFYIFCWGRGSFQRLSLELSFVFIPPEVGPTMQTHGYSGESCKVDFSADAGFKLARRVFQNIT